MKTRIVSRCLIVSVVCIALNALWPPAPAAAEAISNPARLNTFTTGNQTARAVAVSANGDTVVAWDDIQRGAAFLQRLDILGTRIHAEPLYLGSSVNSIAVDAFGRLVVVRTFADGSGTGIFASIRDLNDNVIVPEFRVNDITAGPQRNAAVAMNARGDFVVAWQSFADDSSQSVVKTKRFRIDGTAVAPEVGVSGVTRGCGCPDVAIDQQGSFAVTYTVEDLQRTTGEVFVRRFDAAGAALGPEAQVNTTTFDLQRQSRIAMNPLGDFTVVWESRNPAVNGWPVFARRYRKDGVALSGELRVDTQLPVAESVPDVAMSENGAFVVTWSNTLTSAWMLYARSYSQVGTSLGEPFVVSPNVGAASFEAKAIGMDPAGNFAIGWTSYDSTNAEDIYVRRYVPDGYAIASLANGSVVSGVAGSGGLFRYYRVSVPAGTPRLTVTMSGAGSTGDADLYLRVGGVPSLSTFNFRPFLNGNNEQVVVPNPVPGDWYIGLYPFAPYSGVSLSISLQ